MGSGWRNYKANQMLSIKLEVLHLDLRPPLLGIAQGATKLGVVSAMGASAKSGVFYSRVKGEMEEAISKLGYHSVSIARPSMLAGNRAALSQAERPGEKIALVATRWLNPLIPKNYQSVQASDVAAGLYRQVKQGKAGVTALLSGQLQAASH